MTASKRARYAKIERIVDNILSRELITAPPVDVQTILVNSGVDVRFGNLGDVSGLLAKRNNNCIIGINSKQANVRQRFTMAHEYGHLHLHTNLTSHSDLNFKVTKLRDSTSSLATDVDEIEANFFAACLLMPRKFMDRFKAYDCIDDDESVRQIAGVFDVSQHAMSLRLANVYSQHRPF